MFKVLCIVLLLIVAGCRSSSERPRSILNVSYDPTREFFRDINAVFVERWRSAYGEPIQIRQSHGGSGKQARSVIEGLSADVVTLALSYDIDQIAKKAGILPLDWQRRYPHRSAPYSSTIVFLVRRGNPHQVKDWGDLVRPEIAVITPSPKSSGGARWNYLAAWAYATKLCSGIEPCIEDFVRALYRRVPVLDTGARAATTTFAQRGIGDVLITWENEAHLTLQLFERDQFQIVIPSISIRAEPPVAVIERNVMAHGVRDIADAYVQFLYTAEAQEIAARHYFRPSDERIMASYVERFPQLELVSVDEQFGGWEAAQKRHFVDGGLFDKIFERGA